MTTTPGTYQPPRWYTDILDQMPAGRKAPTRAEQPPTEDLFCPIVSADDHALEPADLFVERLPRALRDKAPRYAVGADGESWWEIEDKQAPMHMNDGAASIVRTEWSTSRNSGYQDFWPAVFEPKLFTQHMDQAGVWASLCFPSGVWGFAGSRFSLMQDQELGFACFRAYNDWMLEEWCGAAPERFIPSQVSWFRDAEVAAAEVYRNAERGFRAVNFSENPEGIGFPNVYSRTWDPFFRACEETGTVINLHIGPGGIASAGREPGPGMLSALFPLTGITTLSEWIFAEIPVRFPRLAIVLADAGASWVPMALERIGRAELQIGSEGRDWPSSAPLPHELVHRNFHFTSVDGPHAPHTLTTIGEDHVLADFDRPHLSLSWPHAQDLVEAETTGLAPEQIAKVCHANACRLYRHRLPPAEMIDASEVGRAATARR